MGFELERRGLVAARAVASAHGLAQAEAAVIASGSNVLVHLRPAPVVARVMTGTVALHDDPQRWLEREVSILRHLAPSGVAVSPSSAIAPGPHQHDGLWMIFTEWISDVERSSHLEDARRLGLTMRSLHEELRTFEGDLGGLHALRERMERLHSQLQPVDDAEAGRFRVLRARLNALEEAVFNSRLPAQALHGDISLGNLLHTSTQLVWNDFEDTFRGPVHWDVASLVISLRADGATPNFVRQVLDAYGWSEERDLAPFFAAHSVYDEIWHSYDRQRRRTPPPQSPGMGSGRAAP